MVLDTEMTAASDVPDKHRNFRPVCNTKRISLVVWKLERKFHARQPFRNVAVEPEVESALPTNLQHPHELHTLLPSPAAPTTSDTA